MCLLLALESLVFRNQLSLTPLILIVLVIVFHQLNIKIALVPALYTFYPLIALMDCLSLCCLEWSPGGGEAAGITWSQQTDED